MMESGFLSSSTSSLSNLGWIPPGPIGLCTSKWCNRSLTIFSWIMGGSFTSLILPSSSRGWALRELNYFACDLQFHVPVDSAFRRGDYPPSLLDHSKYFEYRFTSFWFIQLLSPVCHPAHQLPCLKTELVTFSGFFENQIPVISLVHRAFQFRLLSSLLLSLFL